MFDVTINAVNLHLSLNTLSVTFSTTNVSDRKRSIYLGDSGDKQCHVIYKRVLYDLPNFFKYVSSIVKRPIYSFNFNTLKERGHEPQLRIFTQGLQNHR